jgi:hypothetical protein
LTIVAPAGWIVGLVAVRWMAGPPNYTIDIGEPDVNGILGLIALAALPVMICLITIWAVLMHERLAVLLPRGAAQLGAMYLSLMAMMRADEPLLWTMPWAVALGLASFVVPPLVVSLILRWFRWRLVRRRRGDNELPPLPPRYQFRLADLFLWMTLLAVFLALGTAILSGFDKEPSGFEGLGPLFVGLISLMLCVPVGVLSVAFTWLLLAEGRRRARAIVAVGLQLVWVASILYVLAEIGWRLPQPLPQIREDTYLTLATPPAFILLALVLFGLARLSGWKMVRLPKR